MRAADLAVCRTRRRRAECEAPTVVTVQHARALGDRVYILLVIADDHGEETMERLGRAMVEFKKGVATGVPGEPGAPTEPGQ